MYHVIKMSTEKVEASTMSEVSEGTKNNEGNEKGNNEEKEEKSNNDHHNCQSSNLFQSSSTTMTQSGESSLGYGSMEHGGSSASQTNRSKSSKSGSGSSASKSSGSSDPQASYYTHVLQQLDSETKKNEESTPSETSDKALTSSSSAITCGSSAFPSSNESSTDKHNKDRGQKAAANILSKKDNDNEDEDHASLAETTPTTPSHDSLVSMAPKASSTAATTSSSTSRPSMIYSTKTMTITSTKASFDSGLATSMRTDSILTKNSSNKTNLPLSDNLNKESSNANEGSDPNVSQVEHSHSSSNQLINTKKLQGTSKSEAVTSLGLLNANLVNRVPIKSDYHHQELLKRSQLTSNDERQEELDAISRALVHKRDRANKSATGNVDGFCAAVSLHDGVVICITDSIVESLGFPKDMWVGRSFVDFVNPADRAIFLKNVHSSMSTPFGVPLGASDVSRKGYSDGRGQTVDDSFLSSGPFFCRLRHYKGLRQGNFSVKGRRTLYVPFKLTVSFTDPDMTPNNSSEECEGDEGGLGVAPGSETERPKLILEGVRSLFLIVTAIPIKSAFRCGEDEGPFSELFVTTHDADCSIKSIEASAIQFTGYLKQDVENTNLLLYFRDEDLMVLRDVHRKVTQNQGKAVRSKHLGFKIKNGDLIWIQTEWSCFVCPWTKKLEFVIGKHLVIKGPKNPDVFRCPAEPDDQQQATKELSKEALLIGDEIKNLMKEGIMAPTARESESKPEASLNKDRFLRRRKELASYMGSLLQSMACKEKGNKLAVQLSREVLGSISKDSVGSSETPPSYHQLNFNDNLNRFFNSQPKTLTEKEAREVKLDSLAENTSSNDTSGKDGSGGSGPGIQSITDSGSLAFKAELSADQQQNEKRRHKHKKSRHFTNDLRWKHRHENDKAGAEEKSTSAGQVTGESSHSSKKKGSKEQSVTRGTGDGTSSALGSGDSNNVSKQSGESSGLNGLNDGHKPPKLTVDLLLVHNRGMEKRMVEAYRKTRKHELRVLRSKLKRKEMLGASKKEGHHDHMSLRTGRQSRESFKPPSKRHKMRMPSHRGEPNLFLEGGVVLPTPQSHRSLGGQDQRHQHQQIKLWTLGMLSDHLQPNANSGQAPLPKTSEAIRDILSNPTFDRRQQQQLIQTGPVVQSTDENVVSTPTKQSKNPCIDTVQSSSNEMSRGGDGLPNVSCGGRSTSRTLVPSIQQVDNVSGGPLYFLHTSPSPAVPSGIAAQSPVVVDLPNAFASDDTNKSSPKPIFVRQSVSDRSVEGEESSTSLARLRHASDASVKVMNTEPRSDVAVATASQPPSLQVPGTDSRATSVKAEVDESLLTDESRSSSLKGPMSTYHEESNPSSAQEPVSSSEMNRVSESSFSHLRSMTDPDTPMLSLNGESDGTTTDEDAIRLQQGFPPPFRGKTVTKALSFPLSKLLMHQKESDSIAKALQKDAEALKGLREIKEALLKQRHDLLHLPRINPANESLRSDDESMRTSSSSETEAGRRGDVSAKELSSDVSWRDLSSDTKKISQNDFQWLSASSTSLGSSSAITVDMKSAPNSDEDSRAPSLPSKEAT